MNRRRTVGAVATAALLLTACSSGTSKPEPGLSHRSALITSPSTPAQSGAFASDLPTSSDSPSSAAPIDYAIGGTATDGQGDTVHLTVSFGAPAPASSQENGVIDTCSNALASADSSLDRSLAVPIHVSMEVTSGMATTVQLKLGDNYQAVGGGQVESAYGVRLWAMDFSDGAQCGNSNDLVSEAANVTWANAAPNTNYIFNAWLILAGSITPSDPTGSHSSLGGLLITPHVSLGGNDATITYLLQDSPNLVSCSAADAAAGGADYVAVEPVGAVKLGCAKR